MYDEYYKFQLATRDAEVKIKLNFDSYLGLDVLMPEIVNFLRGCGYYDSSISKYISHECLGTEEPSDSEEEDEV